MLRYEVDPLKRRRIRRLTNTIAAHRNGSSDPEEILEAVVVPVNNEGPVLPTARWL